MITDIDYCQQDVCGQNTVCTDYDPPLTTFTCDCAAGYMRKTTSGPCVGKNASSYAFCNWSLAWDINSKPTQYGRTNMLPLV